MKLIVPLLIGIAVLLMLRRKPEPKMLPNVDPEPEDWPGWEPWKAIHEAGR